MEEEEGGIYHCHEHYDHGDEHHGENVHVIYFIYFR